MRELHIGRVAILFRFREGWSPVPAAAVVLLFLPALLGVCPPRERGPGALTIGTLLAQVPHTENTLRLEPGAASPPARVDDFGFLQGRWVGEGLGGAVDELWSRPAAGTMVGAFRLIREERVVFYEIYALEEEEETVALRIKHFDPGPGLPGWEARDRETLFRLVAVEEDVAWFSGLTFRLADPNTLLVHLALRSSDGEVREERFHFQRVPD
jgi:hypothetical protein